ncbi:uncharacterized protein F5147DRAFT_652711 [Suillus discolor]|uniref:Uncharacterized protein n=1 Tax=Suillus discolor TaxID=1912936 RepID=A0A9P7JTZ0_9AGAM|nr:uncharacterized protein F5147DRAFT_652711 [Suillus discolor]KAG2108723.1 hypothetical protein F5147DRAFT_652711 [Suillus discolor]
MTSTVQRQEGELMLLTMPQSITKASKEKPSRSLQGWEMYVHLHYQDKVKDAVKCQQDALKSDPNAKPAKKMNLSIIKEQTKLAFEGESKDVKEEIWAAIEVMKEKKRVEMDEIKKNSASLDNAVYISKIRAVLTQFFKELHLMTGWTFLVLMDGPDAVAGGTLDISSFHVGTTKLGKSPHLQHFADEALELPPLEDNMDNFNLQLPILPMPPQWQIPATNNDLLPPEAPPSVSGVTSPRLHRFFTSPSNIYDFTHDDGLDAGSNSSLALLLADTASVSHTDALQHSATTSIAPQCQ